MFKPMVVNYQHGGPSYWVVVRVYDGDTFDVVGKHGEKIRVRVWGIDAPEHGQIGFRAAKKRLEELLMIPGMRFSLVESDRYGRQISKVITGDGRKVEEVMLREGLAWWYKQFCPRELHLMRLHKEARASGVGLWVINDPVAPWVFRRGRGRNRKPRPLGNRGREVKPLLLE